MSSTNFNGFYIIYQVHVSEIASCYTSNTDPARNTLFDLLPHMHPDLGD